jgi:hypothetical protein
MKSYQMSDAEIENQMLAGRLTFLFNDKGEFFKDTTAPPPEASAEKT